MAVFTNSRIKILVVLLFLVIVFQICKLYADKTPLKDVESIPETPKNIVQIAVYYEALCPDSRYFFIHHLEDAHSKLGNELSIKLIPYGKAKTKIGPNNEIDFDCQHGEIECFANKIHACTIEIVPSFNEQLSVIGCMIRDNLVPENALLRCAKTIDYQPILNCAKARQGSELLKLYGEDTRVVKPSFIPTITVDGSKGDQASLLKKFTVEVCKHFPENEKPLGCS